MTVESPAKLNLGLLIEPPRRDGYHPLDSLAQTIEWCDTLTMSEPDDGEDRVTVSGADIDPEENLVSKTLRLIREEIDLSPVAVDLDKTIPVGAGLGGGSSNAAAMLVGAGVDSELAARVAPRIGADVPLFLTGGTLRMRGVGEIIEPWQPLRHFAVAVVIPDFGLDTGEVYRRWDALDGPVGTTLDGEHVPPSLREGFPLRNDLLPAALDVEPRLGDFMADVRAVWGLPVCLTGTGSACFAYFPTVEEAQDAADAVSHLCSAARGVELRDKGVAPREK